MRVRTFAFTIFLISISTACVSTAYADNWGHWRGPTGNGVAVNAKPPLEWSETKNIKWKAKIPGKGSGSPVIWDKQVFAVSAVPTDGGRFQFQLLSFDRASGKPNWERTATVAKPHEGTHSTNGYASASPCTDGEHVYAHFGSQGLYCHTMDGGPVWNRQFGKMRARNGFGEGSSPTIAGNLIIVPWEKSALFALNKLTGDIVWQAKRDEPTCWATPLVVEFEGKQQVIMNGQNKARAYDLETGKELWTCGGQTERPCATPVASNGLVYVGSGHRGSFLGAFKLDGKGDISKTKSVAWTVNQDTPDVASPILSQGRLYYYKGKSGQLSCIDAANGKPYYAAMRIAGLSSTYASPVAADGRVYLTDRSGTIAVIKDDSQFELLATNQLGEPVDATPAPVDNQLFVRGEEHLFCIAE
jgi:outer membrane protein assembly factor BamB